MTKYILISLLIAATAQARPEWLYKPVEGMPVGTYTEARVTGFGRGTPAGAIYQGQDRKQAYRDEQQEQIDPETGETNLVTVSVAVPVAEAYYAIGMDGPREATQTELDARTAAAAQAEANRIAKLAAHPVYRAMLDELQTDLMVLGLSIPTDETAVMVRMAQLKAAGQWTDAHRAAKAGLGVTWQAINEAGIRDDVRAIWTIMQGQQ